MVPSARLVLLLVIPAIASIALVFAPDLLTPLAFLDAVIVAAALADARFAWRPLVTAERECPSVLALGRPNRVRAVLVSRARRPLAVDLNDDGFLGAAVEGLPASAALGPHASAHLDYHLRPERRGKFELGDLFVRYPSPLGLWKRRLRIPARAPVRVYPDFQQVRAFELLARENRELAFVRAMRRRGGESEFARLRDYAKDDEYRAIDWKASARRQKLVAREYQMESNQQVLFVLDAGRMMTTESGGLSQFDHALNASLMLGHVAAKTGDEVGLLCFAERVLAFARPQGGKGATNRLIRAAYDVYPELVESDYQGALAQVALQQRKRALITVFTQVLDARVARSVLEGTRALLRRHLPLIVLFRDLDVTRLLESADDRPAALYVKGAAAEVWRARQAFIADLRRAGALVLDVAPRELTSSLINQYLEVKARHLL